ncbi:hypothetical protein GX51_03817 [Blastomyces parvus]|uniref:Uncharacterized protein n=1 Tax=Blastomyces parvus TaxID=2060905 RepID=A0A2B7X4L5_9EURO|nr:hypothetical protein GX51_03817 [Blastomyces parvus]
MEKSFSAGRDMDETPSSSSSYQLSAPALDCMIRFDGRTLVLPYNIMGQAGFDQSPIPAILSNQSLRRMARGARFFAFFDVRGAWRQPPVASRQPSLKVRCVLRQAVSANIGRPHPSLKVVLAALSALLVTCGIWSGRGRGGIREGSNLNTPGLIWPTHAIICFESPSNYIGKLVCVFEFVTAIASTFLRVPPKLQPGDRPFVPRGWSRF